MKICVSLEDLPNIVLGCAGTTLPRLPAVALILIVLPDQWDSSGLTLL